MSEQAVREAWARWCLHFPREFANVSRTEASARLASYVQLLADIPDPIMEAVGLQVLAEVDWFPSIKQVRECAARVVQPNKLSASEAWLLVHRTINRDRDRAKFDDPIIARTVEIIGLKRLRFTPDEDAGALFAQFRDTFETLRKRQRESLITPRAVHQLLTAASEQLKLGGTHGRQLDKPKATK